MALQDNEAPLALQDQDNVGQLALAVVQPAPQAALAVVPQVQAVAAIRKQCFTCNELKTSGHFRARHRSCKDCLAMWEYLRREGKRVGPEREGWLRHVRDDPTRAHYMWMWYIFVLPKIMHPTNGRRGVFPFQPFIDAEVTGNYRELFLPPPGPNPERVEVQTNMIRGLGGAIIGIERIETVTKMFVDYF